MLYFVKVKLFFCYGTALGKGEPLSYKSFLPGTSFIQVMKQIILLFGGGLSCPHLPSQSLFYINP